MTAKPNGLAGRIHASQVNRAVKFTTQDAQDPNPDTLVLIKRDVNVLDLLEVSSPGTWATRVAALPSLYRRMFESGTYSRIRNRYSLYGGSAVDLVSLALAVSLVNNSGFLVSSVPSVAAGYWWDPGAGVTGLGTAGFSWAEGGAHAAFAETQATVAKQPSQLSLNGHTLWRFTSAADTRMITAGNVTAGWAGSTYIAMWHRMPNGTPTSGSTTMFAHNVVGAAQRRVSIGNNGTSEQFSVTVSSDGTATQQNFWPAGAYGDWHWLEFVFTPGQCVMYKDFTLVVPDTNVINIATLNDPAVLLAIGAATAAAVNQNDQDLGMTIYANGVPSLSDRFKLRNVGSPV